MDDNQKFLNAFRIINDLAYDRNIQYKYQNYTVGMPYNDINVVIIKQPHNFKIKFSEYYDHLNNNLYHYQDLNEVYNDLINSNIDLYHVIFHILVIPYEIPVTITNKINYNDIEKIRRYLNKKYNTKNIVIKYSEQDIHYYKMKFNLMINHVSCSTYIRFYK